MRKFFCSLVIFISLFSCKDEVTLNFSETQITDESDTIIEINIPKAQGNTEAAKQINTTLAHFVNSALNIDGNSSIKESTEESVADFKKAYKDFKNQIGKALFTDLPAWEVLIDGEVIYKNEAIVTIAMNSSINTGAASSNLVFKFLNFDIITGKELDTNALINDVSGFTEIAKKYYERELLSASDSRAEAFNNETFELPEHLGFSKDGVILFYDTFNTSTNNIIEFTIPYVKANKFLNF